MTDIAIDQMNLQHTRAAAQQLLDSTTGDLAATTPNGSKRWRNAPSNCGSRITSAPRRRGTWCNA
jgi:hypothetical protein